MVYSMKVFVAGLVGVEGVRMNYFRPDVGQETPIMQQVDGAGFAVFEGQVEYTPRITTVQNKAFAAFQEKQVEYKTDKSHCVGESTFVGSVYKSTQNANVLVAVKQNPQNLDKIKDAFASQTVNLQLISDEKDGQTHYFVMQLPDGKKLEDFQIHKEVVTLEKAVAQIVAKSDSSLPPQDHAEKAEPETEVVDFKQKIRKLSGMPVFDSDSDTDTASTCSDKDPKGDDKKSLKDVETTQQIGTVPEESQTPHAAGLPVFFTTYHMGGDANMSEDVAEKLVEKSADEPVKIFALQGVGGWKWTAIKTFFGGCGNNINDALLAQVNKNVGDGNKYVAVKSTSKSGQHMVVFAKTVGKLKVQADVLRPQKGAVAMNVKVNFGKTVREFLVLNVRLPSAAGVDGEMARIKTLDQIRKYYSTYRPNRLFFAMKNYFYNTDGSKKNVVALGNFNARPTANRKHEDPIFTAMTARTGDQIGSNIDGFGFVEQTDQFRFPYSGSSGKNRLFNTSTKNPIRFSNRIFLHGANITQNNITKYDADFVKADGAAVSAVIRIPAAAEARLNEYLETYEDLKNTYAANLALRKGATDSSPVVSPEKLTPAERYSAWGGKPKDGKNRHHIHFEPTVVNTRLNYKKASAQARQEPRFITAVEQELKPETRTRSA